VLNNQVFYHGIIRKTIVGFGSLFSNIYIDRNQGDSVNGTTIQRVQVPLAYAPKEKWLVRLDSDPNLENNTYITLPRMSFEITGYTYDATRKTNRMSTVTAGTGTTTQNKVFSPVPYNIDIYLYILTKTQEDGLQILEQILPTFTPEYTLQIKQVDEMGITTPCPVILNSVTVQDDYDGDFQTRRFVTHTLSFTIKTSIFGATTNQGIISKVGTNLGQNEDFSHPNQVYTAQGDVINSTVSSENWLDNF
jgi:hypothetical protein